MRCKGLFDTNKIVYVPVIDEPVGDMMRDIKSYASSNRVLIKTKTGIFVNQDTMEVEKVIRCELIGDFKCLNDFKKEEVTRIKKEVAKIKKEVREEFINRIKNGYKNGMNVTKLSKEYNVTRAFVYKILKKEEKTRSRVVSESIEERNKQVINAYKNGVKVTELAKKYNLTRASIYNILNKEKR